jgi:hypothetical protein
MVVMFSACGPKPQVAAPIPDKVVVAPTAKVPRADLVEVPDDLKPAETVVDQGYIDIVDGASPAETTAKERIFRVKSDAPFWIGGWAYDETSKKAPNRVWIQLAGKTSGARFFLPADRVERLDVATGFKVPWAHRCGFATPIMTDHNIPPGSYDVKVYQINGKTVELTRYYSVAAVTIVFE